MIEAKIFFGAQRFTAPSGKTIYEEAASKANIPVSINKRGETAILIIPETDSIPNNLERLHKACYEETGGMDQFYAYDGRQTEKNPEVDQAGMEGRQIPIQSPQATPPKYTSAEFGHISKTIGYRIIERAAKILVRALSPLFLPVK